MGERKLFNHDKTQQIAEVIALKTQKETEDKVEKKIDSLIDKIEFSQRKFSDSFQILTNKINEVDKKCLKLYEKITDNGKETGSIKSTIKTTKWTIHVLVPILTAVIINTFNRNSSKIDKINDRLDIFIMEARGIESKTKGHISSPERDVETNVQSIKNILQESYSQ